MRSGFDSLFSSAFDRPFMNARPYPWSHYVNTAGTLRRGGMKEGRKDGHSRCRRNGTPDDARMLQRVRGDGRPPVMNVHRHAPETGTATRSRTRTGERWRGRTCSDTGATKTSSFLFMHDSYRSHETGAERPRRRRRRLRVGFTIAASC